MVLLFFLFVFTGCSLFLINPRYSDLPLDYRDQIKPVKFNFSLPEKIPANFLDSNVVYTINKDGLIRLSRYFGKKIIVVKTATFCKPCKEKLPEILEYKKEIEKKGLVLFVSPENYMERYRLREIFNERGYNGPLFFVDIDEYGDIRTNKKLLNFDKDFFPNFMDEFLLTIGFPSYIVIDPDGEIMQEPNIVWDDLISSM
ncbi:peroxiredoxin family protein [Luteibaculum oceani]|uniref:Redoxin domain-containing protein n=1 Tax=Luteibaculum oceani TaxID=1294296 RepID=A0A5C6UYQ6_9FLAO|nr:redoxin domain-containing protein [Luteibaculum oceani]TXC76098.1 redoxin domain-containing protein [Luteibaculum oceani]